MNDKKHIWDFLSADEQKLSALILCLFCLTAVAGMECFKIGDVPSNLKDLIETIVFSIAGINVVNKFSMTMQKKEIINNDNQKN